MNKLTLIFGLFVLSFICSELRGQDYVNINCKYFTVDGEGAISHVHIDRILSVYGIRNLGRLPNLKSITCKGISLQKSSNELEKITALEWLTLTEGGSEGPFQKLQNLKRISFHNSQINSELFEKLGHCKKLEVLEFSGASLIEGVEKEFQSFLESNTGENRKLRTIVFDNTPVSVAMVEVISKSSVSNLTLSNCKIEQGSLSLLAGFRFLEYYSNTAGDAPQITDRLISNLVKKNPDLVFLGLSVKASSSLESEEGLLQLSKLKKLKQLTLNLNSVPSVGKRIVQEIPELEVLEILGKNLVHEFKGETKGTQRLENETGTGRSSKRQ